MSFIFKEAKKRVDATELSEAAFARLHGFPQTTLNSWLSGGRTCHLHTAYLLADALSCPLTAIWDGQPTKEEELNASIKVIQKMISRRGMTIEQLAEKCGLEGNTLRKIIEGKSDMTDDLFKELRYTLGFFGVLEKCLYTVYCHGKRNPRSLGSLSHNAALNPDLPVPDQDRMPDFLTPAEFIQQMNLRLLESELSADSRKACMQELNGMPVLESTDKMKLAFIRRLDNLDLTDAEFREVVLKIVE